MVRTRFLPHIEIKGATYFVTWRLADNSHLNDAERDAVLASLLHHDSTRVDLYAASVMSNHVHCVVQYLQGTRLSEWVSGVKRFTARQINTSRASAGHVWQDKSFDHIVRDAGSFAECVQYIVENPVEAGDRRSPERLSMDACVAFHPRRTHPRSRKARLGEAGHQGADLHRRPAPLPSRSLRQDL